MLSSYAEILPPAGAPVSAARYPVPAAEAHAVEQTIQRSRFVATLGRAATSEEAAAFVRRVAAAHPGATHNCWAYAVGPPGSDARVGMSDDGEPHGTAGRPMLAALLHGGVGEIVAVVTRYYGGTKLGTGGLVRAYTSSVQLALASLPRDERVERVDLRVLIDYADVTAFLAALPVHEAESLDQVYAERAAFDVRLPAEREARFRAAVVDLTRGRASFGAEEDPDTPSPDG